MRTCVLDLGGMSFHLLHARRMGDGELLRLGGLRLATGLGRHTMQTGVLDRDGFERGLEDLGVLCQEARTLAPETLVAVATSAIRAASNAHAFVAQARTRYGLDIQILSAAEEAELSFRGAASELHSGDEGLAVVDLGGGSCELALGQGNQCRFSHSADIGVLPLREAFAVQDRIGPIKAGAISEVVRMALRPARGMIHSLPPAQLVFASGTARAVHRLAKSVLSVPPGQMTLLQARRLRDFVIDRHPVEFLDHDVDVQRVEVIAIAVIVIETLMSTLGCLKADFSSRGLREGVVLREFAQPDYQQIVALPGAKAAGQPMSTGSL